MTPSPCCGPGTRREFPPTTPTGRSRRCRIMIYTAGAAGLTIAALGGCAPPPTDHSAPATGLAIQRPSVQWLTDPEEMSNDPHSVVAIKLYGDGLFRVGADFTPGTYRSAGPRTTAPCHWQRLSATAIGGTAVIESGSGTGAQYVIVRPTDAALLSQYCQPWSREG